VGDVFTPLDLPNSIRDSKIVSVEELRLDKDERITKQEIAAIENSKIARKFIIIVLH
jgi:hypothetical protein